MLIFLLLSKQSFAIKFYFSWRFAICTRPWETHHENGSFLGKIEKLETYVGADSFPNRNFLIYMGLLNPPGRTVNKLNDLRPTFCQKFFQLPVCPKICSSGNLLSNMRLLN